jgi:hypothetical protein
VGTDKASEGGARPEDVEDLAGKYTPAWESGAPADDARWEDPAAAPVARQSPPQPLAAPPGPPSEPFAPAPPDDPIPARSTLRPTSAAAEAHANLSQPPAQPPAAQAVFQPPPAQKDPRPPAIESPAGPTRPRQARTIVGMAPPDVAQAGAKTPAGPVSAPVIPAATPDTETGLSGIAVSTAPATNRPARHDPAVATPVAAKPGRADAPSTIGDFAVSVPPTPLQPPVQPAATQLPTVMIADAAFPAPVKAPRSKVETYDEITVAAPRRGRKRKFALMAAGFAAAASLALWLLYPRGSDRPHVAPQAVGSSPTLAPKNVAAGATAVGALPAAVAAVPPVDEEPIAEERPPATATSVRTEERRKPVRPTAIDVAAAPEKNQETSPPVTHSTPSNTRKATTHKAPQPAKAGAIVRDVPF